MALKINERFKLVHIPLYRNMSSVNEKTRQLMRETKGLIDALVGYIQKCVVDSKVEEKVIVQDTLYFCLRC